MPHMVFCPERFLPLSNTKNRLDGKREASGGHFEAPSTNRFWVFPDFDCFHTRAVFPKKTAHKKYHSASFFSFCHELILHIFSLPVIPSPVWQTFYPRFLFCNSIFCFKIIPSRYFIFSEKTS